jgi:flagellar hook-length control protein FliK
MIGSMNSFAMDSGMTSKTVKSGGVGFGMETDGSQNVFGALIANLANTSSPVADQQAQSAVADDDHTPPVSDTSAVPALVNTNSEMVATIAQSKAQSSTDSLALASSAGGTESGNTPVISTQAIKSNVSAGPELRDLPQPPAGDETGVAPTTNAVAPNAGAAPSATQNPLSALSALLETSTTPTQSAIASAAGQTPASASTLSNPAKSASPTVSPNSAEASDQTGQPTPNPALAQPEISGAVLSNKSKPTQIIIEHEVKGAAKSIEPVSASLEGGFLGEASGLSDRAALGTSEAAARPSQLTPQTIPMLAATLVRRLESGAKQFSMRLDPPELGQVEVKLTMEAGKKVRAVISADRPEALADLMRSARDLVRALNDAGLNVDDNGLTFVLNDPAGDQGQSGGHQAEAGSHRNTIKLATDDVDNMDSKPLAAQTSKSNDPFQSWQRARIALTA